MRQIILHYHIFKNAGSSIDRMLKESFGARWKNHDLPSSGAKISPKDLEEFILEQPELLAVSSHQAVPPLPDKRLEVFPIVCIRHPIDRAYSAYLFEWGKQKGTPTPEGPFADYIAEKFSAPRLNAIEDFQAFHLANRGYESRLPSKALHDEEILANARDFLSSVPCLGLVDRFDDFLARMETTLAPEFSGFKATKYRENVLQEPDQPVHIKIEWVREAAGKAYSDLVARNQLDLRLYEFSRGLIAGREQ